MPGGDQVIQVRGKLVFVRHGRSNEIASAVADNHTATRDTAANASCHKFGKPKQLTLIGVLCTHLSCGLKRR